MRVNMVLRWIRWRCNAIALAERIGVCELGAAMAVGTWVVTQDMKTDDTSLDRSNTEGIWSDKALLLMQLNSSEQVTIYH